MSHVSVVTAHVPAAVKSRKRAAWRDLPPDKKAEHLLSTPTLADSTWTEEQREPGEKRDAFIRRILLGKTAHVEVPEFVTVEHPDALVYRRTADAFRAGDLDLVKTLIAPEVVWHVPGEHDMAGLIDGRDALLTWLARLGEMGFWLVEHDVLASDRHVCAISTMGARRVGVDVRTRVVSIFRVPRRTAGRALVVPRRHGRLERDLRGVIARARAPSAGRVLLDGPRSAHQSPLSAQRAAGT